MDGGSRVEVQFNNKGQPIGDGSVSLSSFLGPLVREIVPVTIPDWRKLPSGMEEVLRKSIQVRYKVDEQWQKYQIFKQMDELWRASKSRLVKKIREAPNEEERLKLQLDNIKSMHDWKDFVKEKTSTNFKAKSEVFQEMRKKQVPHTCSRRGYARLTTDLETSSVNPTPLLGLLFGLRHIQKKNGEPINTTAAVAIEEMKRVERDSPLSSLTNVEEDALSKVLGPEKRGRVRGFGKGVTLSKLAILSQKDNHSTQIREEQLKLKEQVTHM